MKTVEKLSNIDNMSSRVRGISEVINMKNRKTC